MSSITENDVKILCDRIAPHLHKMLSSSGASTGDLAIMEDALGVALNAVRSLLVEAALKSCSGSAHCSWACPSCKKHLTPWSVRDKIVVTRYGDGPLAATRYRCRSCRKNFYPLQMLNDLLGNQFTLGARELIANEAVDASFAQASARLQRMGVSVSPSEVERISDQIGAMRKEEEELVRIHLHVRKKDLPLPLYKWDDWDRLSKNAPFALMSVDGAKVRSDQLGPKGLEWFEVRSGVLTLSGANMPKAQIAGDISPDALFESLRSIWRQSPVHETKLIFVADGAEWIWDRVTCFFPKAVQILDVFHAAQHVGTAARAAWGDDDARARMWSEQAISLLVEYGPRWIIRRLIAALKGGSVADPEELIRNIRYLLRHRHRMHYAKWREQGIAIGSGTMESRIKQVSSMRLRRPGMKWTKNGADLMLRLRAAVLSDSLPLTFVRHRQICANRVNDYRLAA